MNTPHYAQIRARNAMAANKDAKSIRGRDDSKNIVKSIPDKIINHGLLAAAADAVGNPGQETLWKHILKHLQDEDIKRIHGIDLTQASDLDGLLEAFTSESTSSQQLRIATSEVMEWLNYARRLITT